MSMRIDSFKGALSGGGARPNLFRVTCGFPSGSTSALATGLGAAAVADGGAVGGASGGAQPTTSPVTITTPNKKLINILFITSLLN